MHNALPKLLEKVQEAGLKAVVKGGDVAHITELDDLLWIYRPDSFLAHGSMKSKSPEQQPLYLTTGDENPAGATVLVLIDNMTSPILEKYDRCLELFDGTDMAAVMAARVRWKTYKEAGHGLIYWQQTEQGGWTKKA